MSDIKNAFTRGKALIPFITLGDPDLDTTAIAAAALAENGGDIIELGIPFSDPVAEDPVIQSSYCSALKGGITTEMIFPFVSKLRETVKIPLVFVTYANVVLSCGPEKFFSRCKEAGIDGISFRDLPFEESAEFRPLCDRHSVCLIYSLGSCSKKRAAMISKEAAGFLHVVSKNPEDFEAARQNTHIPLVSDTGRNSDGVVITRKIAELIHRHGKDSAAFIEDWTKFLKTLHNF